MKLDVKGKIKWVTSQWSKPAKGNYVSIKEILAYSVGGMGVQFIAAIVNYVVMSASSLLIGSVYGLKPQDMQTIAVIGVLISLMIVPFRGMMMDNSKNKNGKYRPIILWSSVPAAVIAIAMAYIPMNANYATKFALIAIGFTLINIFYNQLLYVAYSNLVQVISPNSQERTTIVSLSSIIFSMAPTLTGLLFPIIAEIAGGTMIDIKIYRLLFPVFGVIGILLTFFAYFGTKERVVQSAVQKEKIPFFEGLKSTFSNKYLLLFNVKQILLFARNAASIIFNWIFVYQLQNNVLMGLLMTLMGTASFIGMVAAPILVKFFGKRNVILYAQIIFGLAYGATFFTTASFWGTFVLIYIANIANSTELITGPSINADILDYHQWKTGKRMDGFFGNIGAIVAIIGLGTGYVVPAITQSYGIITNYDVLFDFTVRDSLFKILAIVSLVGGLASAVPMIFFDLNEKKLKGMMRDLKRRALTAEYEAGNITQEVFDEQSKELDAQAAEEEAKEAAKHKKSKKGAGKEIEVPMEGEVSNTAAPSVDVVADTAVVVGEQLAENQAESTEVAEAAEDTKTEDSDAQGGKQ